MIQFMVFTRLKSGDQHDRLERLWIPTYLRTSKKERMLPPFIASVVVNLPPVGWRQHEDVMGSSDGCLLPGDVGTAGLIISRACQWLHGVKETRSTIQRNYIEITLIVQLLLSNLNVVGAGAGKKIRQSKNLISANVNRKLPTDHQLTNATCCYFKMLLTCLRSKIGFHSKYRLTSPSVFVL